MIFDSHSIQRRRPTSLASEVLESEDKTIIPQKYKVSMKDNIPLVKYVLTLCLAKKIFLNPQFWWWEIDSMQAFARIQPQRGRRISTQVQKGQYRDPVPETKWRSQHQWNSWFWRWIRARNKCQWEQSKKQGLDFLPRYWWLTFTNVTTNKDGRQRKDPTKDLRLCGKEGQGTHPD